MDLLTDFLSRREKEASLEKAVAGLGKAALCMTKFVEIDAESRKNLEEWGEHLRQAEPHRRAIGEILRAIECAESAEYEGEIDE